MNSIKMLQTNYKYSFFIFLFLYIFVLTVYFLDFSFSFSDHVWSSLFVLYIIFVYIFRYINKVSLSTIYSLFYMTSILFLGGRFLAKLIGYEAPIFDISFFGNRYLQVNEINNLMFFIFLGFISLEIGLYFSKIVFKPINNISIKNNVIINKYILLLLLLLFLIFIFITLKDSFLLVITGGYLSLYEVQTFSYNASFLTIIKNIFLASVGIFLLQENKNIRNTFLFLLGVYFISTFIMGVRGGFITYLLLLFWIKSDFGLKQVNISKFLILLIIIFGFLSIVFNILSLRGEDIESVSFLNIVYGIFYNQGYTLMVFNESMRVDSYPIIPYFQSFIPGVSFLISQMVGALFPYDINFGQYLSYNLDPVLYNLGYGTGWSFFSDAYVYSSGNILFFSIFILIFSVFINFLQIKINSNLIFKLCICTIALPLFFLPRSGLYSIFPLFFYSLILFGILSLITQLFRNKGNK